jgi:hypothetical protein
MRDFWDVAPCNIFGVVRRFIMVMMEAVHTSETSVCSNEFMRRYIPEGSHVLHKKAKHSRYRHGGAWGEEV